MKSPFSKTLAHAFELTLCGLLVILIAWLLLLTGVASPEDLKAVVLGTIGLIIAAIPPKYARASGMVEDRVNQ